MPSPSDFAAGCHCPPRPCPVPSHAHTLPSAASYALLSASDTSQMKSWSSWLNDWPLPSGNRVSAAMTALNSPPEGTWMPHACERTRGTSTHQLQCIAACEVDHMGCVGRDPQHAWLAVCRLPGYGPSCSFLPHGGRWCRQTASLLKEYTAALSCPRAAQSQAPVACWALPARPLPK